MRSIRIAVVAGAIVALAGTANAADAAEIRARCDYKAPNPQGRGERTRVRVDGKDVAAGTYTVTVNGTYTATATTVADEDEGDSDFKTVFSSNRGHITGGATEVPKNLGATGSVTIGVAGVVEDVVVNCPGRTRIDVE